MKRKSPLRFHHFATVYVPLPITEQYTYGIPDELDSAVTAGIRVIVPFGPRLLTAFVTGISDDPGGIPVAKIKGIIRAVDEEQVFDEEMLSLAKWVADYYCAGTGEVLKTAMPPGTMTQSRTRIFALESPSGNISLLTMNQQTVLGIVAAESGILARTLRTTCGFDPASAILALERKGFVRTERELSSPRVRPKLVRWLKPVVGNLPAPSDRAREQKRCIGTLARHPDGFMLVEFLERYGFSRGVVNAVVDGGWAYYEDVEVSRTSRAAEKDSIDVDHPLTTGQTACFEAVMEEMATGSPRPVLLHGVTGSGKTRIYIELVRKILSRGRSAIILVPEIALTPQTTRFFSSVFPGTIAVLHSAMSPGERHDAWFRILRGEGTVVIGPRSAVFAPARNLGLIVIDEEHDGSYKQSDTAPRYHARDVAIMRAYKSGIPIVLGSATPSLESWRNAQLGKYRLCRLEKRILSRPMPSIKLADMREERAAGNQSSLSRLLREELAARLERGEKSIILMNRRGFATGIQCRECGEVLTCPNCTTVLTFHSSKGLALCHLCGHGQIVLEHCPNCGSAELLKRGRGTQRIEQELAVIFGESGIIRMDADTTQAHDAHYRLLEEFRTGDAPVLLGTQMVAKGLDFPNVTLVGIISADASLYIPDFRAAERTFQLITQVAGRAGRHKLPGTVVLQTNRPDNYAVASALAHDYEGFVARESTDREEVGFPPYSRLILIEFRSQNRSEVENLASGIAEYFARYLPDGTEILGPADAPIAKIRSRHRIHILLKIAANGMKRTLAILRHVMSDSNLGRDTLVIDVDPIDLM